VTYEAAVRSTTGQPARTLGIIEAELAAKVQAGTISPTGQSTTRRIGVGRL